MAIQAVVNTMRLTEFALAIKRVCVSRFVFAVINVLRPHSVRGR